MKSCSKCKIPKPLDDFYRLTSSKDGFGKICKICDKEYYCKNKEKIKQRIKRWREKIKFEEKSQIQEKTCSKCKLKKSTQEFYKKKESKDGFGSACKNCVYESSRNYYEKNKEEILEKNYKWKEDNLERYKELSRNWNRTKRNCDPTFKLRQNVSRAIRTALLRKKQSSITEILPYTMEELRRHLESQFSPGMSWDNYGTHWEIDHIYPQSLLKFSDLEEENFLKCWSINNLRPLQVSENRRKSNKIDKTYETLL